MGGVGRGSRRSRDAEVTPWPGALVWVRCLRVCYTVGPTLGSVEKYSPWAVCARLSPGWFCSQTCAPSPLARPLGPSTAVVLGSKQPRCEQAVPVGIGPWSRDPPGHFSEDRVWTWRRLGLGRALCFTVKGAASRERAGAAGPRWLPVAQT